MAVEWKTDPSHGNFNTGTQLGHKSFLEKTKGLVEIEKRFDLTKKHDEIMEKIANKKQNTEKPEDKDQEKKASTNSNLEIQENVKQFLISDLYMSDEDVDKLLGNALRN